MKKKMALPSFVPLLIVLLAAAFLFAAARIYVRSGDASQGPAATAYTRYERGKVTQILADSTTQSPVDDGGWRGQQLLLVKVTTGQYKGEILQVYNYVGPIYDGPVDVGDSVVLNISVYEDGSHIATVQYFDRLIPFGILIGVFLLVTVLIGGKTGAKSLIGLLVTLATLFCILLPALFKGADTVLAVVLASSYIAVVSLCIMSGTRRKTWCAIGGTIAGVALAAVFGLVAQRMAHIDGLQAEDAEALLQIRQTGGSIKLSGLLVGGFILSALGAVMDVTMGIASSISEIHDANPDMSARELFRSGMNVGRDMVGTMTNTLILAFLGSSFSVILYVYSISLQPYYLISSPFVTIEVLSSLSSSIGVILSIPITAALTAFALGAKKKGNRTK